jgi:hypothetical protein
MENEMTNKETKTHWFSAKAPIITLQTLPERDFEVIKAQVTDNEAIKSWLGFISKKEGK